MSKSHKAPRGKTEEKVGVPLGVVLEGLVEAATFQVGMCSTAGLEQKIHLKYQGETPGTGQRGLGKFQFPEQGKRLQE